MTAAVDRAVKALPLAIRAQVLDELAEEGRAGYAKSVGPFMSYFAPLALSADPAGLANEEMLRVSINELEPARFRETAGRWPVLRARFRDAVRAVTEVAKRDAIPGPHEAGFMSGMGLGPVIEAIVEGYAVAVKDSTGQWPNDSVRPGPGVGSADGLAQIEAVISAVTSLMPAALSVYKQQEQTRQLAEQRRMAEAQAAQAKAQWEAQLAQQQAAAQQAAAARQTATTAGAGGQKPGGGGVPWYAYAVPAGLALAIGLVLLLRRRKA